LATFLINSRSFKYQLKNGETFASNPSDVTLNLAGNILEKVQTDYTVQIGWAFYADSINTMAWDVPVSGLATWEKLIGTFEADDFSVGDRVTWVYSASPPAGYAGTVIAVNGAIMVVQLDPGFPVTSGVASVTSEIHGLTPLEGVQFFYNLIENQEAPGYLSKIDGSIQGFFADGVGFDTGGGVRDLGVVPMTPLGSDRSWLFGTVTVQYIQDVGFLQEFRFVHEYIVLPWYLEGELLNLQNLTPPSLFSQGNSLKYIGQYDFLSTLNNPNTQKTGTDSNVLGSTGWFNESNNGFTNDYGNISIVYSDTGGVIPSINSADTTEVTIRISGVNFNASTVGILAVSKLPEAIEYENNTNFLADNFILETQRFSVGAPSSGTILTNVEATVINATELEIVADISYTSPQLLNIEEGDDYVIAIIIEDDTLTNTTTNRVTQLIDLNQFIKSANVPNLMTIDEEEGGFYSHVEDIGGIITSDYKGWIEDGVLLSRPFYLNIDLLANITQLYAKIIVTDGTTEFELESFQFDLSNSFITSGNVQQISLNTTRGFQLKSGDQFNFVRISNLGQSFINGANREKYNLYWGFKAPFEKWLANADVPAIFTDFAKQQNGLNQNSANYSSVNGYEVYVQLNASVSDNNSETSYQFRSPALEIYDYDKAQGGANLITCSFTTEDSGGTDLAGQILQGQDTIVVATFTNTTPGTLVDCVGITRLYENETGANAVYELSSLRDFEAGQPIIPIVGEPLLKVDELGGGIVKTYARIDGTKINAGASYCISPRLFCDVSATVLIVDINATFVGGPAGTWDLDLVMVDGDTNPLPAGTNAVFTLKDGATIIGTLAYVVGDVIGVNPPTSTTGIGTNILNYMSGTIGNGQTLTFDKRDWAQNESFITDALNADAIDLGWFFQANDGFNFSNIDSDICTVVATVGAFDFPRNGTRVTNDLGVFGDWLNGRVRLVNQLTGFTRTVEIRPNVTDCASDFNDISNGLPVLISTNNVGFTTQATIIENRFDGTNFVQTTLHNMSSAGQGVTNIACDSNHQENGRSVLWLGTSIGNTAIGIRGFERFLLLYFNGVGYTEVDFEPLITAIFNADFNSDLGISWQNIEVASNGDVFVVFRASATTKNGMYRFRFTGATFTDPNDWTSKKMTGVAQGFSDGIGSLCQTNVFRGLGIVGYDGVLNQTTGTNPEFVIGDSTPNVGNIRMATHNLGTDEYGSTMTIGGVASGDLDGVGGLARFQVVRDTIGLNNNDLALAIDNGNFSIYRLDLVANSSTKIVGTGSAGDEDQLEY